MGKVKQETLQLAGGNHNSNRRELDYYPTPKEATIALIEFLTLPKDKVIWEPACGDGAMSKVIENYGYKLFSSDIRKDVYGESERDFLKYSIKNIDAIITNPPFNLAEQFIIKSVKEASVVALFGLLRS